MPDGVFWFGLGSWIVMKAVASAMLGLILSAAVAWPATKIADPVSFVTDVLRHFAAPKPGGSDYNPPEDIYTPRLQKLIRDDRKRSKGDVGCLDFVFWVDGQDWSLSKLDVTAGPASQDRQTVIARFINLDTKEELHFDFLRVAGRWLLDDVHSMKEPRWTLSEILKCPN
jgi:hypothetical protein